MNTPDTPQRVNTTLTHKTGDGTNLFDSSQRDVTPTPLDQSMEDHTTTIQRVRIASPLTPRREPNLFETVQNLSKQNRQGISPTTQEKIIYTDSFDYWRFVITDSFTRVSKACQDLQSYNACKRLFSIDSRDS